MKKLLAAIVVVAMYAPAMAATITFQAADVSVGGEATIAWTADAGVVGMGIEVDVDADIDEFAVDSFFDVLIDLAYEGNGYAIGDGIAAGVTTKGAIIGDPGVVDLPAMDFAISVGGLEDDGIGEGTEEAPMSGTIVLKAEAGANVTLSADMLRGSVVGYDGAMTVVGLDQSFTINSLPPPEVKGDCNGDCYIDGCDILRFIECFGSAAGTPAYKGCACVDFNDDGYVDGGDVPGIIAVFGTTIPNCL